MSPLEHLVPLINAHAQQLSQPGVLTIRPGYKLRNHWPTSEPAVVVLVSASADLSRLPTTLGKVPVDVRRAGPLDLLRYRDPATYGAIAQRHQEFRAGAFPELDVSAGASRISEPDPGMAKTFAFEAATPGKTQIPYQPASIPLTPVSGRIRLLCHASPDAGWPTLKAFLAGIHSTLTVAMYDFTSAHILKAIERDLKGRHALKLVLDDPAKNPTADQTDPETVSALACALGKEFQQTWALVRSNSSLPQYIYPSAYHIKVAVRDSAAAWISSGNWNNSNQPDIDPIAHPSPGDQAVAAMSDRDWHVVIENPDIARQFEAYIRHDFDVAHSVEAPADALALQPLVSIPFDLRSPPSPGTFIFHPLLQITGEDITITPLLTPDVGSYRVHVLHLLRSAQKKLFIQLQYIHPPASGVDPDFKALIEAVIARINAGVDVRIICSQYQASGGWLERLQEFGFDLNKVRLQNGVHNKGFVVDSEKVIVGSQNWSGDGVLRNRDASVLIESKSAAKYYEAIFLHDWKRLATQTMNAAVDMGSEDV